MKTTTTRALLFAALSASLTFTACKKEAEGDPDDGAETNSATTDETTPETTAPEDKPEDKPEDTPAAEVDETMFIKAFYEVTCVQTRVEDAGKAKEIIAEIMPRYGFDEASYKAAEAAVAKKPNVEAALKAKMESCTTKEYAEGLLKAGAPATDAPTAEADAGTAEADAGTAEAPVEDKPKTPPKPKFASSVSQRGINSGGVAKGQFSLKNPKRDLLIGSFKGIREGRPFNIPLSGKVSNNGSFTVSGKQGSNNVSVSGKLGKSSATGTLKGSINKQPLTIRINAR
jgi:hypothetical protein